MPIPTHNEKHVSVKARGTHTSSKVTTAGSAGRGRGMDNEEPGKDTLD